MKKILFPTDLSDAANHAFIYALQLADKWNASITTIHVYQEMQIGDIHLPGSLYNFYQSMDLYSFENYRDSIPVLVELARAKGLEHVEVRHMLEQGEVVESILEAAQKEGTDLIVMGTTGARGLKEIFLGSVAGEVLENASCPVLAVPAKTEFDGKIDNIAYATSYKDEDVEAIKRLAGLLGSFHPQLHCVNVDLAHTEEITQQMDQFQDKVGATEVPISYKVLEGTDMKKALTDFLEAEKVDIIAMLTRKRSFVQELFNYSKTKMMAYHANTPVLALHI
ncbi:MAG: universal stress protein [Saprospiraceae bacterium]|nr:universal stress protein [Saprospiraceae bacterium]